MTGHAQESQENVANAPQQSEKEINFRKQEALFLRQLEQEKQEKERLRQELELARKKPIQQDDDEDDNEPYIDHKKLNRKLSAFGQNTQSDIQKAMEMAKQAAKEELKQELWLENNADFYDVLQKADLFAQQAPKLAENILRMPDNFERKKLVYQTIKELGIDKPAQKQSSVQDKIEANRRSPYYQPTGMNSAPYAAVGDYSPAGQKAAHDKMVALKAQLRL